MRTPLEYGYLVVTLTLVTTLAAAARPAVSPCPRLLARVLVSAEPFGFGPAAAMAEVFPHLRSRLKTLSYIGKGHTLDLHTPLPYDSVHDYGVVSKDEEKKKFLEVAKDFDVFLTAMDAETAGWAKEAGLKVVFYDALAWFWPELPPIVHEVDVYYAQNFLGVEEKLAARALPHAILVPPIVSLPAGDTKPEDALLVNLGGLSNPFLSAADLEGYARSMMKGVESAIASDFGQATFTTSRAIAAPLQAELPVRTFQPHEVQAVLAKSRLAVMTSGLGNIYEAAAMGKRVLWLPPTNDSQGQQVKLLARNGMCDSAIDWHELLDIEPIDYFGPQEEVLKRIAWCLGELSGNEAAEKRFVAKVRELEKRLGTEQGEPALAKLARRFGSGGAEAIAKHFLEWIESKTIRPE